LSTLGVQLLFNGCLKDRKTISERDRFVHLIQGLPELEAEKVREINVQLPSDRMKNCEKDRRGIF